MLCSGFKTAISVDRELCSFLFAQVKVQESVLMPLILVIVMDNLAECVKDCSTLELLMHIILFCVVIS